MPKKTRGKAYNDYMRKYMKQYYIEHPEKRKQYDINQAINLLTANGYEVFKIPTIKGGATE